MYLLVHNAKGAALREQCVTQLRAAAGVEVLPELDGKTLPVRTCARACARCMEPRGGAHVSGGAAPACFAREARRDRAGSPAPGP